jgi:Kef-type K+ transport system membrane component KefB
VGDVFLSGGLGFAVSYFFLNLPLISSLFVAIALTATSVGVSVAVWQETGAIKSPDGQLLVDIAEMDDISGIALMALLFAVVPHLKGGVEGALLPVVALPLAIVLLKLVGFGAFCIGFSRYLEHYISDFFRRLKSRPAPMLLVAGTGFIIAGLAGLIGFSVAIGAFFAGLVFSRDPKAVRLDASFGAALRTIHAVFLYLHWAEYRSRHVDSGFGHWLSSATDCHAGKNNKRRWSHVGYGRVDQRSTAGSEHDTQS